MNRLIILFHSPLSCFKTMPSLHPSPEEAAIDDKVLQWKHVCGLTPEEIAMCSGLAGKMHKNKVERTGVFTSDKIFGMARRRITKGGELGTRDHCHASFQAPNIKLVLRSKKQVHSWLECLAACLGG
jgi:hypothetical protein